MVSTTALKRYNGRLILLGLFYALFLIVAVYGFKHQLVPGTVEYLVAVLPALPIIGIFAALGRYLVDETDEYLRMLMVRRILWASGLTLSVATVWGFLDNFGLVGHADGYWLIALWFIGLGIGGVMNRLTLGDGGC